MIQGVKSRAQINNNSNNKIEGESESNESNKSFTTFIMAVSVEWFALKADCNGSNRLLVDKYCIS